MTNDNRNERTKQDAPYFCVPNHIVDRLMPTLRTSSFTMLMVLIRHRNAEGFAFPSYDKLVELTGWSRQTVAKALAELVAAGMIVPHPRGRRVRYSFPCLTSTESGLYVQSTNHTSLENGLSAPVQKMDRISTENGPGTVQKSNSEYIKPIDKDIPIKPKRESTRAPLADDAFETFWDAYGRKGSKAEAKRAWRTHTPGVTLETVLEAVRVYLLTKRVLEGYKLDAVRFIARKVWENPTLGEEATGNTGKNGHYGGYQVPIGRKSQSSGFLDAEEETF